MACASSNRLWGLLALLAFVFASVPAAADVHTNYGPGEYGRYREQIAGFVGRADALEAEVRQLTVQTTYCIGDVPTLEDDRATARALRAKFNKLWSEYATFRSGLMQLARDTPGMLSGFDQSKKTPENPNFWTSSDALISQPGNILSAKEAVLAKAKTIDCKKEEQPPPPPPPPPPPVDQVDPLKDLHRPALDDLLELPPPHDRFCIEAEKAVYLKMVAALQERAFQAQQAAGRYRIALSEKAGEIDHMKTGGNPNAANERRRQLDLVEKEIAEFEPIYQRIERLFNKLVELENEALAAQVEDCRPPGETGALTSPTGEEPLPVEMRQPHVPTDFCSEDERAQWIRDNLNPLDDKAADQAEAWQAYVDALKAKQQMTGDKAYHDRVARELDYAERELAKARGYVDLIKSLYEEARAAKIKRCGGGSGPDITIGIGIGVGGGHDHHDRDHHDRDHRDPPREPTREDREPRHD